MATKPLTFRDFWHLLVDQHVPLNYVLTTELLDTPLHIDVGTGPDGLPRTLTIEIEGNPPKGFWQIRLDEPHGILWDGQFLPYADETGSPSAIHAALQNCAFDLRCEMSAREIIDLYPAETLSTFESFFTTRMQAHRDELASDQAILESSKEATKARVDESAALLAQQQAKIADAQSLEDVETLETSVREIIEEFETELAAYKQLLTGQLTAAEALEREEEIEAARLEEEFQNFLDYAHEIADKAFPKYTFRATLDPENDPNQLDLDILLERAAGDMYMSKIDAQYHFNGATETIDIQRGQSFVFLDDGSFEIVNPTEIEEAAIARLTEQIETCKDVANYFGYVYVGELDPRLDVQADLDNLMLKTPNVMYMSVYDGDFTWGNSAQILQTLTLQQGEAIIYDANSEPQQVDLVSAVTTLEQIEAAKEIATKGGLNYLGELDPSDAAHADLDNLTPTAGDAYMVLYDGDITWSTGANTITMLSGEIVIYTSANTFEKADNAMIEMVYNAQEIATMAAHTYIGVLDPTDTTQADLDNISTPANLDSYMAEKDGTFTWNAGVDTLAMTAGRNIVYDSANTTWLAVDHESVTLDYMANDYATTNSLTYVGQIDASDAAQQDLDLLGAVADANFYAISADGILTYGSGANSLSVVTGDYVVFTSGVPSIVIIADTTA